MKKLVLLVALTLATTALRAEATDYGMEVFTRGANASLWATNMSSNGRYLACWLYGYSGVLDCDDGTLVIDENEGEMFDVNNEGTIVGYGGALAMRFDGTYINSSGLAKGITNDGETIVGYTISSDWSMSPFIYKNGTRSSLPTPTEAELGFEINQGFCALGISDDESIIIGAVIDNYSDQVGMLWRLQDDGSYAYDLLCVGLFEPEEGSNAYYVFEPKAISPNGKYIVFDLVDSNGDDISYWGRYDTTSGEWTTSKPDTSDYYATGIADDGTIVGYYGGTNYRYGAIWRSKDSDIRHLQDLFPSCEEFVTYDDTDDFCCPTAISADGQYIAGMAWTAFYDVSEDDEAYARRISWRFDVTAYKNSDGISTPQLASTTAPSQVYNLAGQRVDALQKGVYIVDGKKVIKK